jgi:hypothetical protein
LPKHIWEGKSKDYYVRNFFKKFVNTTCVSIDSKSDYTNNIILDYTKCDDYYIDKYQFKLVENINILRNYLT